MKTEFINNKWIIKMETIYGLDSIPWYPRIWVKPDNLIKGKLIDYLLRIN